MEGGVGAKDALHEYGGEYEELEEEKVQKEGFKIGVDTHTGKVGGQDLETHSMFHIVY